MAQWTAAYLKILPLPLHDIGSHGFLDDLSSDSDLSNLSANSNLDRIVTFDTELECS